ncbi:kynurenine formamidase [Procambarus clarkii]|uniref:kynurenine formamidase n=1 Tax=Procambarus clarkii TaxID=6728 RepID=UPI001E67337D|nr:kynurenine formamidase-like [Procambarus clarkii]XP_045599819.1 kynurenine formamidase-like [Procambarus clarkii]XP_045599820.1 kynurenine formamidase-like [Procambarus clarkii]XP_045599821.1 kynurenine formamidase-like [Procambarus clarkii]
MSSQVDVLSSQGDIMSSQRDVLSSQGDASQLWRTMSHEELEQQYSPSRWSKRHSDQEIIEAHVRVANERSHAARTSVTHRRNIAYGHGPRAVLDVYGEDLPPESGVLVYVHGGYWQELDKDVSSYVVQPLHHHGVVTVVVGYDLAPQVTVEMIVKEVRTAVAWACRLANGRGSRCVVLAGWSAGAQLVIQALTAVETTRESEITPYTDIIRGVVCLSGVFDLRPLVSTYVNDPLQLTESTAWQLSPLASVGVLGRAWARLRVLVAVGQHDSPEFKRQSAEFCQECVTSGLRAEYLEVDFADHFSIVEDLADKDFILTQRIFTFLQDCHHGP